MDYDRVEWLHDHGYLPDWIYYTQNGKSPQHNFDEQRRKFREEIFKRERERELQKEIEKRIDAEVEKKLPKVLDQVLEDLLKGFSN